MRRKRGSRYTWFPIDPTYEGEDVRGRTYYDTNLVIGAGGGQGALSTVLAIPLVPDQTPNVDTSTEFQTLRDQLEGQAYIAKRIVGKTWAGFHAAAGETAYPRVIVAAAVAVCPVDDNNPSVISLSADDINPLLSNNATSPWMFRRTWILGNPQVIASGTAPSVTYISDNVMRFPSNTSQYGSVMDGGHVDIKVARRISREQRLFWITAAAALDVNSESEEDTVLQIGYDLRVLGAMRKNRNQSTFK